MQLMLANIGWSDKYDGEHMEGPGYERWNFRRYDDGFLLGILRGQGADYSPPRPRIATGWTVVFVASQDSCSKIVGFYKNCEILDWTDRPEGELVPEYLREYPNERYQYNLKAPEGESYLIPLAQRPEFPWIYGQSSFVYITDPGRVGAIKENRQREYQEVHRLLSAFPNWGRV